MKRISSNESFNPKWGNWNDMSAYFTTDLLITLRTLKRIRSWCC